MKRFEHRATATGYTIVDVNTGIRFAWQGDYSSALMHERLMNQFPREEYCSKCLRRKWQGSATVCCK